jgi:hypothetical protein
MNPGQFLIRVVQSAAQNIRHRLNRISFSYEDGQPAVIRLNFKASSKAPPYSMDLCTVSHPEDNFLHGLFAEQKGLN